MNKKVSFQNLNTLKGTGRGLSSLEVAKQRSLYGYNEIVEVTGNPLIEMFLETLKDPMIWFLVCVGGLFILVGETTEAVILFIAVLPLLFMDSVLHWRTQASTAALRGQLSAQAKIMRDGKEISVNSMEIVPGDLVLLGTNHFLPADGVFENAEGVQVDESVLTGEAFPIQKHSSGIDPFQLAQEEEAMVDASTLGYAGTRILTGKARLRVLFTGSSTAYGEIVQSVSRVTHERTHLQMAISKMVKILISIATIFCFILTGVRLYQGHGWVDAILSGATLAIAAVPEEFPLVFTFFLGVGVYRMARLKALVRRAVSVENLGRVTCICTDKTGTVTAGDLKLTHVDAFGEKDERPILKTASAASDELSSDPVDQAILEYSKLKGPLSVTRIHIFPFTEDRKRQSVFVQESDGRYVCHVKGAPEIILSKSLLTEEERLKWMEKTSQWAREGHKVLACGWIEISQNEVNQKSEPQNGLRFLGLMAFEDPPRPEIMEAMAYCHKNQIGVLMITGDHPETAVAIAKEIKLGGDHPVVISAEENPEKFRKEWLRANPDFLSNVDVVARCTPIQKFNIVKALQNSGNVVAVTGDGVNDVPALKVADIGIAMGLRGTRSAKEVSSIILADDNFNTIVSAIMEGRQLFSNLKTSFEYLLLFHVPFVLTAALIPLLGYPLLYFPVHIVWLELLIHPTALFAFQLPADKFKSAPPNRGRGFLSFRDGLRVALIGLGVSFAVTLSYVIALKENLAVPHARAKVLAILAFWSAGLVLALARPMTFVGKSVILATVFSTVLIIQSPLLARYLHLSPLHFTDWVTVTAIVGVFLIWVVITIRWSEKKIS